MLELWIIRLIRTITSTSRTIRTERTTATTVVTAITKATIRSKKIIRTQTFCRGTKNHNSND